MLASSWSRRELSRLVRTYTDMHLPSECCVRIFVMSFALSHPRAQILPPCDLWDEYKGKTLKERATAISAAIQGKAVSKPSFRWDTKTPQNILPFASVGYFEQVLAEMKIDATFGYEDDRCHKHLAEYYDSVKGFIEKCMGKPNKPK